MQQIREFKTVVLDKFADADIPVFLTFISDKKQLRRVIVRPSKNGIISRARNVDTPSVSLEDSIPEKWPQTVRERDRLL